MGRKNARRVGRRRLSAKDELAVWTEGRGPGAEAGRRAGQGRGVGGSTAQGPGSTLSSQPFRPEKGERAGEEVERRQKRQ